MRNALDKRCRENENTHFMSENRTVYERMSKNVVETKGPQMTSQRGAYALHTGGYMHLCACTRPRAGIPTFTYARTHARARTRMHTPTNK